MTPPEPKNHDANEGERTRTVSFGLSIFYVLLGLAHIVDVPLIVRHFGAWDYPDVFRVLVGVLEIIGGVGLLSRRLATSAATLLAMVMAGAVFTHLFLGTPALALVPLALLILLVVVGKRQLDKPLISQSSHEVPPGIL